MKYVLRTFKQTSPGDADAVLDGLKELRSMFGWSGIGFLTKSWSNPMGLVTMARTFDSTEEIYDHFENITDQMRAKIQKINEMSKSSWSLMLCSGASPVITYRLSTSRGNKLRPSRANGAASGIAAALVLMQAARRLPGRT